MSPLLSRLGVDNLVSLTTRLRDDERIKSVSPDSWVLPSPTPRSLDVGYTPMYEGEGEVWFDWAFVDFWKSNCCEFCFFPLFIYIFWEGEREVEEGG